MKQLSRRSMVSGTAAAALTAAIAAPEAFARPRKRGRPVGEEEPNLLSLSAEDWEIIAARARSAGDSEGAKAAQAEASRVRGSGLEAGPMWVTSVAKKALIAAFKYGRSYIPKRFLPYTDKIVRVLETTDAWEQSVLTAGLMAAGLPPDLARDIARWVSMVV